MYTQPTYLRFLKACSLLWSVLFDIKIGCWKQFLLSFFLQQDLLFHFVYVHVRAALLWIFEMPLDKNKIFFKHVRLETWYRVSLLIPWKLWLFLTTPLVNWILCFKTRKTKSMLSELSSQLYWCHYYSSEIFVDIKACKQQIMLPHEIWIA